MKRTSRIDYKILSTIGERIPKILETENIDEPIYSHTMTQERINELSINESVISDLIGDFIDENELSNLNEVTEVNIRIENIKDLRTKYRYIHTELKLLVDEYDEKYEKRVLANLQTIKSFIKEANDKKKYLQMKCKEEKDFADDVKSEAIKFQAEEVARLIDDLMQIFGGDSRDESDESIKKKRNQLESYNKEVRKIGEKIHLLMKDKSKDEQVNILLNDAKKRYVQLLTSKDQFVKELNQECEMRELDKNEKFQISSLNIKLAKFKGYESTNDIFTFQSTFEKLYLKSTPHEI